MRGEEGREGVWKVKRKDEDWKRSDLKVPGKRFKRGKEERYVEIE